MESMGVTGFVQLFLLELWADVFLHLVVVPCGFPSQVEQAVTPPRSAQHTDCDGQM